MKYMLALHFADIDTISTIFNVIRDNNKINILNVNGCMKYSLFNLICVCDYCIHNRDYMNKHIYGCINTILLYNMEYDDMQKIQHINYNQSKNIIYEKYNNNIIHMYYAKKQQRRQRATTATIYQQRQPLHNMKVMYNYGNTTSTSNH